MQGKISLDWGAIFDILSIINVKINLLNGPPHYDSISNFGKLENEIKEQIGQLKFDEIIKSQEYKKLYELNKEIFMNIDNIRKKENLEKTAQLGLQIDSLNTARYLAKQDLQNVFFKGAKLTEVKN